MLNTNSQQYIYMEELFVELLTIIKTYHYAKSLSASLIIIYNTIIVLYLKQYIITKIRFYRIIRYHKSVIKFTMQNIMFTLCQFLYVYICFLEKYRINCYWLHQLSITMCQNIPKFNSL